MQYLSSFDYVIIGVYFAILIGLGLYLKKKASASLEDYFLGGRKLPWWALGMSGMASCLDITGTMLIISFLYMLGPRGLYIAFRGGAVLVMIFALIWVGKWHRRSRCITGAEWMIYRFGNGPGGQFARIMSSVSTIVITIGMLAYMVKGIGLFLSMFLPFTPTVCALIMITVATIYTLASGFYGVVFTDMFQSVIILVAVVVISAIAIGQISSSGDLAEISQKVTGNAEWTSTAPCWKTTMPTGYEAYRYLLMFALFYLLNNVINGISWGDDPKYFGARSDRECGKLSFLWTWMLMFRWPMMIGFAVLGIYLIYQMFPDQTVLIQASEVIKTHLGNISKSQWPDVLAGIVNSPSDYPQELISGLSGLLGDDWTTKLNLLSYEGTVNPERILPAVLLYRIPYGMRGLILVALIAASMSTFDSNLNKAIGFFVRDIYQAYLRPKADNRELIWASYFGGLVMVVVGFVMGTTTKSINDIWVWIIMGLGGGLIIPRALRFY
jgi:Na+/proline symporter